MYIGADILLAGEYGIHYSIISLLSGFLAVLILMYQQFFMICCV
jgi:hypothetical protein